MRTGTDISRELDDALPLLWALPPGSIAKAEHEIVDACELHRYPRYYPTLPGALSPTASMADILDRHDGLKYLYIFHRDGKLRQAALNRISNSLPTPFAFISIAWRLNDWVPQVRKAAAYCADRSFPATDADIIAEAAIPLLSRKSSWTRWGAEHEILDACLARRDVAQKVGLILAQGMTGPLASVLREALKKPSLDPCLALLSSEAVQPAVRALALQTLLNRKASWVVGYEWQWVEKPLGIRRKKTLFEHRNVSHTLSVTGLVKAGLKDRSGVVRKAAISAVIENPEMFPDARELALRHVDDRSRPVRERAQFLLKP
ncbi:hypothetical protein [Parasphingorhabdus marina]|uniref:hypothetical protein n=1 Tax=Parasphingorhabdus marina TaxID=394732 RepID=UPI000A027B98|nr:hypothetical protein [Parasphingorhabdus marina]